MWRKLLQLAPGLAQVTKVYMSPDETEVQACRNNLGQVTTVTTPHHCKKALLRAMWLTKLKGELPQSSVLGLVDLPADLWDAGVAYLEEALLLTPHKLGIMTHIRFLWANNGAKVSPCAATDVASYGAADLENNLRATLQPEGEHRKAMDFWSWLGK